MIIAVDFDMTLSFEHYPNIGKPNTRLFNWLIEHKNNGDRIVLWTCREGKQLMEAIQFCKQNGLEFDSVNTNLPEIDFVSRKIVADIYIDDLAMKPDEVTNLPREILW